MDHCSLEYNRTALEQYFISIMQIILTRLQNSRTETLTLRFVRFYHFVSARDDKGYSADFVIEVTDKVQEGYVTSPSSFCLFYTHQVQ